MNEPPIEYTIEEIARSIMCLSIRVEITNETSAYLNEVEAGAKRILRLIQKAREKNNDRTKEN